MVRGERLKGEGGGDTEEDEVGRREDRLPSTRTACRVDAVGQHRKAEAVQSLQAKCIQGIHVLTSI